MCTRVGDNRPQRTLPGTPWGKVAPVAGLIPETVVRTGAMWTVAVNLNQDLLGKTMLVLRRPATAVIDLSPSEWAQLHIELNDLVPALGRLFSPDQVNLAFLMNQAPQVHLHVVPRYRSPRTWGGLVFTDAHWGSVFGPEQRPLPQDLLAQLAAEIRAELGGSG
jgi:diadenosine tetraphosphate (Ap4A) HIT family hydrolase